MARAGPSPPRPPLALPLIVVFALSMAWLVSLGITQVRALDAARETARAAARSEEYRGGAGAGAPGRPGRVARSGGTRLTARSWSRSAARSTARPGSSASGRRSGSGPRRLPRRSRPRDVSPRRVRGGHGPRGGHDGPVGDGHRGHVRGRGSCCGPPPGAGAADLSALAGAAALQDGGDPCDQAAAIASATVRGCGAARSTGGTWRWEWSWSRGCPGTRWSSRLAVAPDRCGPMPRHERTGADVSGPGQRQVRLRCW